MWLFAALATGLVYYSFAKHISERCPSTSPTAAQRGELMWLNAHRASVSPYVNWLEWFCSPLWRALGCPGEGPGSHIGLRGGHCGGYWASQRRFEAVATIFKSTEQFLSASPRAFTGPDLLSAQSSLFLLENRAWDAAEHLQTPALRWLNLCLSGLPSLKRDKPSLFHSDVVAN